MSDSTTRGVRVQVSSRYLPEHSDPSARMWMFAYRVTLTNVGKVPVQLRSRHWVITDATGHEEHVRGPGVVGEQPRLQPGETFSYSSGCPLRTSMGTMHGTYQMLTDEGEGFDAVIAPFTLADPLSIN
ncbi:MAG: Co2+/Mg2+ efflux protein ApaG [Alphaproteobacteria bacterium]|nr:Co2+/Mg2+ efflux protein ApaG [Alphaproteobacteria bacterium]